MYENVPLISEKHGAFPTAPIPKSPSSIEEDLGGLHVTVAVLLKVEGQEGEGVPWDSTRDT